MPKAPTPGLRFNDVFSTIHDLDIPVAIRKRVGSCTKHHIVSYNLCPLPVELFCRPCPPYLFLQFGDEQLVILSGKKP